MSEDCLKVYYSFFDIALKPDDDIHDFILCFHKIKI